MAFKKGAMCMEHSQGHLHDFAETKHVLYGYIQAHQGNRPGLLVDLLVNMLVNNPLLLDNRSIIVARGGVLMLSWRLLLGIYRRGNLGFLIHHILLLSMAERMADLRDPGPNVC